jgi:hypothetical protein
MYGEKAKEKGSIISTICIDQMLTHLVSKKVHTMLALEFSTDFRFVCLSS